MMLLASSSLSTCMANPKKRERFSVNWYSADDVIVKYVSIRMSDCSIKTVISTTTKNNYGEAFADLPAMQRAVAHANSSSKLLQR